MKKMIVTTTLTMLGTTCAAVLGQAPQAHADNFDTPRYLGCLSSTMTVTDANAAIRAGQAIVHDIEQGYSQTEEATVLMRASGMNSAQAIDTITCAWIAHFPSPYVDLPPPPPSHQDDSMCFGRGDTSPGCAGMPGH